jgi:hypothetical protein
MHKLRRFVTAKYFTNLQYGLRQFLAGQRPVFYNIILPQEVNLTQKGWTLSPRGIVHPFIHPQWCF